MNSSKPIKHTNDKKHFPSLLYLLLKIEEVICLVNEKELEGTSPKIISPKVYLTQLG